MSFILETFVDFPDDALSYDFPLTHQHIDSLMANIAALGIKRVTWGYYGDGHGGYFLPSGIAGEGRELGFDQNQWGSYAQTMDILGNPLRAAVEAAHRHGLEIYAYFKPYETGIGICFPEGSLQARAWGRLPHIGGYLTWLDPFVVRHPHLRIKRRTDDLPAGQETQPISSIRLTKADDAPTRVTREHLQIWTSDQNYRYQRQDVGFTLTEHIEQAPCEVRGLFGQLLTEKGAPVRVLTLSGLNLHERYVVVTTDFEDGPGDFTNNSDCIFAALDAEGREIPGVFATGTEIWFPELENFENFGLSFDTGRGPDPVTIDLPSVGMCKTGVHVYDVPDSRKLRGCIGFARGHNDYLPGALCETEPEVQAFWQSCIHEMIEAGVDGVELREESHSTHTDTPEDYGFNPAVLERAAKQGGGPGAIAKVRSEAYTAFVRASSELLHAHGKVLRMTMNMDWFRPAEQRPRVRKLAYPANIDFQWQTWVDTGMVDAVTMRQMETPFENVFGGEPVVEDMVAQSGHKQLPITINRYIYNRPELIVEYDRIKEDGRFNGLVLYEVWGYTQATADGRWLLADEVEPDERIREDLRVGRAKTAATIRKLCDRHRG